jgi:pimeloyl-ACP methyl ester carboxylesterase
MLASLAKVADMDPPWKGRAPMEPRGNAGGTTAADRLAARLVEGLPITTRRLDLAGVSTSLLEGGEGPPIVLLHGQGGFAEIMGGLIANLVDKYRVIAPDLPGLGRSVVQDGTLDVPGVVRWLRELIAKTCDQPPILLGVSMGGSIAARFAIERGDAVSKLILVDSGSLGPFRPPPSLLFALIRMIKKPDRAGVQRMQRQIFFNVDSVRAQMGDRLTALEDYQIDRAKQPTVNAANRAMLRKMGTKPIPDEELGKIEVPVALIWGRHDRVMPLKYAERAGAKFGWPLYVIDDAGHIAMAEQPAKFGAALSAILET